MAIRLLTTIATAAALRPLIIIGRPGAGKSTIAERLIAHPDANAYNVDLDVCVPQRMRDNARVRIGGAGRGPARGLVSFGFCDSLLFYDAIDAALASARRRAWC